MRLFLLFCLGLLMALPGRAQERVRNVHLRVADSSQLEVRYDLVNARPGDSIYLEVRSRLRGSLRILPEFVRGDIGKRVVAGTDRRIVWNALANGYSLNEEVRATVLVKAGPPITLQPPRSPEPVAATKPPRTTDAATDAVGEQPREKPVQTEPVVVQPAPVEARPTPPTPTPAPDVSSPAVQLRTRTSEATVQPEPAPPITTAPPITQTKPDAPLPRPESPQPDTVASRKKRYAGPAWALLSAVLPGFGNIFVQTPKPKIGLRPVLSVGCYALLAYGLQQRQKSRDVYAIYEQQKSAETGDPYYNVANAHYHRYYLATRGALVVAAADVILTFFKGMRTVKETKSVTLRPGLQAGQPTAVVRYSF